MKRRVLAIILLCVGIAGLLLPWKYTLFEDESYRIEQTPTGGIFTVRFYEELHSFPWDNIMHGVSAFSMEEMVEKLLSGDVTDNALAFISSAPEAKFPGMDKLYAPKMPAGYDTSFLMYWSVDGYYYSINNKEQKVSGDMILCMDPENCWECRYFNRDYQSGSDDGSVKCYRLIDGTKVIREGNRVRAKGHDSGFTVHLKLQCKSQTISDYTLMGFGAKHYFSTHPKILMIHAIDIGHGVGIVATLTGIGLLTYPLLRKKRMTAEQES